MIEIQKGVLRQLQAFYLSVRPSYGAVPKANVQKRHQNWVNERIGGSTGYYS